MGFGFWHGRTCTRCCWRDLLVVFVNWICFKINFINWQIGFCRSALKPTLIYCIYFVWWKFGPRIPCGFFNVKHMRCTSKRGLIMLKSKSSCRMAIQCISFKLLAKIYQNIYQIGKLKVEQSKIVCLSYQAHTFTQGKNRCKAESNVADACTRQTLKHSNDIYSCCSCYPYFSFITIFFFSSLASFSGRIYFRISETSMGSAYCFLNGISVLLMATRQFQSNRLRLRVVCVRCALGSGRYRYNGNLMAFLVVMVPVGYPN